MTKVGPELGPVWGGHVSSVTGITTEPSVLVGQGKKDPKGPALSSRGSWGGGGTGKPRTEDQRPKGCTKIWVIDHTAHLGQFSEELS